MQFLENLVKKKTFTKKERSTSDLLNIPYIYGYLILHNSQNCLLLTQLFNQKLLLVIIQSRLIMSNVFKNPHVIPVLSDFNSNEAPI